MYELVRGQIKVFLNWRRFLEVDFGNELNCHPQVYKKYFNDEKAVKRYFDDDGLAIREMISESKTLYFRSAHSLNRLADQAFALRLDDQG